MTNYNKVIKGLEYCSKGMENGLHCNDCPYWEENDNGKLTCCSETLCSDALTLLKRQSDYIAELSHAPFYVQIAQPPVIRCKECCLKDRCELYGGFKDDSDWFCADGERNFRTSK